MSSRRDREEKGKNKKERKAAATEKQEGKKEGSAEQLPPMVLMKLSLLPLLQVKRQRRGERHH